MTARMLPLWLIMALSWGIAAFATSYLWLDPESFSFEQQRSTYEALFTPFAVHVTGGIIALLVGPWQFLPSLRARPAVHRLLGKVYIFAIVASATGGLLVAPSAYGGVANTMAFLCLDVLWLFSTLSALVAARRRQFHAHRVWMIRSFALTFAAVTLRAELGLLIGFAGLSFDQAYAIVPWLCWVGNLVIAEWFIIRGSQRAT